MENETDTTSTQTDETSTDSTPVEQPATDQGQNTDTTVSDTQTNAVVQMNEEQFKQLTVQNENTSNLLVFIIGCIVGITAMKSFLKGWLLDE